MDIPITVFEYDEDQMTVVDCFYDDNDKLIAFDLDDNRRLIMSVCNNNTNNNKTINVSCDPSKFIGKTILSFDKSTTVDGNNWEIRYIFNILDESPQTIVWKVAGAGNNNIYTYFV